MKRTVAILRFIRKNRSQKKRKLYRLAFGVALDKTISVYLGLFTILFLIILYDQLQQFEPIFHQIESLTENHLSWIVIGLIAGALVLSNEDPAIRITSAEYKLSTLSYSIKHIWKLLFIEKMIRSMINITAFFSLLLIFTPFSYVFVIKLFIITLVSTLLVILPQWYFHSLHGLKRWIIYFLGLILIAISRLIVITELVPEEWMISIILVMLLIFQFYIYPKRFKKASWTQIAERNDQKVWNMMIVRFMSDTKTKPIQRKSAWKDIYQHVYMRKPFRYSNASHMYRRIWLKGLQDHIEYVIMILMYFAICVFLTSFKGELVQGLGIVGAMFMYVKLVGSLFVTVFQYPLVHSIPWNMRNLKSSYMFFVYCSSVLLFIVMAIALWIGKGFTLNILWYSICFVLALYVLVDFQLTHHLKRFNNRWYTATAYEQLLVLALYASLFISVLNVKFLFCSFLIILIGKYKKKLPINN